MLYMLCYCFMGALLGAKLLYLLVNFSALIQNPILWLAFISSGFVYYGGLFGAIWGAYLYCKQFHRNFSSMADLAVPMIPLFHGFARIGCFYSGCCYGIESDFLGIEYHSVYATPEFTHRIPVQWIESVFEFILFFVLTKVQGSKLDVYLLAYAIFRFGIEFFRGDTERGIWLLSTSQWISLLVLIVWVYYHRKRKNLSST